MRNIERFRRFRQFAVLVWVAACIAAGGAARAKDSAFHRAINLGGPELTIDGQRWEEGDAAGVTCEDSAFENQSVALSPETDEARAAMIRSSRWSPSGRARVEIKDLPAATYSVYIYVWEDNDPQTFDLLLQGQAVAKAVNSGSAGQWQRLGPFVLEVAKGSLELRAEGGHANLSGIEIWRGEAIGMENRSNAGGTASLDEQAAVLLARNCLECHNASDKKGGLDLTRRQAALTGGESGAALVAGQPDESLMLSRVASKEMPPEGRPELSAEEVTLVRDWIAAGAEWSRDPIDPFLYTSDRRAGYNWWSLQAVRNFEPPSVVDADWPINPIDQFILEKLEAANLRPAPAADRRTLIRRLSYDLLGLPPAPEEVEAFVNDADPRAYERLVDRQLDSPHYGERWARHWLDIVRFGETQGFERNKLRPSAWKYRDFVVEAFNADMPYDEFIRWQIAGDVLRPDDPLAVIASGFLALGPYDLTAYNNGTEDMRKFAREEELEGLVGTVSQAFLGLTINCSRCHDHKFDPITQKEYYQISSALGGTYQADERESLSEPGKPSAQRRVAELQSQIDAIAEQHPSAQEAVKLELAARRSRLECVIRLLHGGPVHTTAPQQPGKWHVLARGDYRHPGEVVSPRGVAAVSGVPADWGLSTNSGEGERRVALAEWIADKHNPLTARGIVNRLWAHHFGAGLVRTPSDLGFQSGEPSHPELLDWLADQLVNAPWGQSWRLKRIHRLIVLSATYRQASQGDTSAAAIDADNRLLWRFPPRRLEAETYRDAVLAVAGELDRSLGGPGYRDFTVHSAGDNENYTVFDAVGGEFNRRSLYRTCVRAGTSRMLDLLDCPDPSVAAPRRSVTTTPLQALALLNNKFMEHHAAKFAERLRREAGDDTATQIRRGYTLAFARQPDVEELAFAQHFAAEQGLEQLCLVLFNASEFLYVD